MLLLYGAGGHARVIVDTLMDLGLAVHGLFDDAVVNGTFLGTPVLGKYDPACFTDAKLVITIGKNSDRKKIASSIKHEFGSVVARTSLVSPKATMGFGCMILQNVIIQTYSVLGNHVILNTASQIDHNCTLGDYVHIAPGAVLCGDVTVGEGTLVGAGAVVTPGVKIGKWCTIGAGAVVIADVPDGSVFVGNPARLTPGT